MIQRLRGDRFPKDWVACLATLTLLGLLGQISWSVAISWSIAAVVVWLLLRGIGAVAARVRWKQ